jgi:hypothetical protein
MASEALTPQKRLTLIVVAMVFSVLATIFLYLLNLKLLFRPQFIQARLREAGIYAAVSDQVSESWRKLLSPQGALYVSELSQLPQLSLEPEWLEQETERNLQALGDYLSGKEAELVLNINLEPVKEQMAEAMVSETGTFNQELERQIPDRIDILGKNGLVSEQVMRQLYQLRVAAEGLNLSLKILAFLLLFTLLTFFLLLPQRLAWWWMGITLLVSGAALFGLTLILRTLAATQLKSFLGERLHFAPALAQESTTLVERFLQTYLSLIQWQSALIFLGGGLVLLLLRFSDKRS